MFLAASVLAGAVHVMSGTLTPPENVRSAVTRALPLLVKGAQGHTEQRTCFACHNQALPLLALAMAGPKGFDLPHKEIKAQVKFIARFLDGNREKYLKGQGQGGQADTAGYALFALELGGWKADATTEAVVEYLLQRDADIGYWKTRSNRPPSEASDFTTTYLALRALRKWASEAQKSRAERRIEAARAWLRKAKPRDTEDRVFRLLGLKESGTSEAEIQAAVKALIRTQRRDGGWAQTDELASDAYATGSALVALHLAGGLPTSDPVYRRGVVFLLWNQRQDGTWLVRSRSRPFQTYYESGFPHGKNQFISMAASGWATASLALSCTPSK